MGDTHTLKLAHSPDSDDLVMWWPLVGLGGADGQPSGAVVDVGRWRFELVGRDVEELNKLAVGGDVSYDITAISCAAYPAIADRWAITACGGSFGEGYGPRVVVREDAPLRTPEDLRGKTVAVPGVNTSAFLAMSVMLGSTADARGFEVVEMLFSEIPGAVARGEADAGVLIHEAQLTFAELGLRELANLGAWWATTTDLPLPLGLNVVRRDLDERFGPGSVAEVAGILDASVRYSVAHPAESRRHLRANMGDRTEWNDDALLDEYLRMYVSGLTVEMGDRGRAAIAELLGRGARAGLCAPVDAIGVV
ncbi:MAG: 1,4-dihydroxy-6-naphtoate synthase [Phycisphaeraceae bacterium]|nr:MAG: 1,4-dihydroxy-6-naphtoate synthase [Phycisphaeraceae bacterium]